MSVGNQVKGDEGQDSFSRKKFRFCYEEEVSSMVCKLTSTVLLTVIPITVYMPVTDT